MKKRATTAKLEPGEHTIDRGNPRERDGTWRLDWSLRLYDGTVVRRTTHGPGRVGVPPQAAGQGTAAARGLRAGLGPAPRPGR